MPIDPTRILYQDDALLAVHKRSGELVVKGAGKLQKLPLLDYLKKEYPGLQTLHRLDFDTSGVVVFARSKPVATALKTSLQQWQKTYCTLVAGRVQQETGTITFPLPARNRREKVPAISHYRVLKKFANTTYLEVTITTGRHHQIRRHLQMISHPLVLDSMYGDQRFNRDFTKAYRFRKFFLHAQSVVLPHPVTSEDLTIEAALPSVFKKILTMLG